MDSLYYMRQIAMHTMDYVDTATTGILSPHVPPVEDFKRNADAHQRRVAIKHALTSIIG